MPARSPLSARSSVYPCTVGRHPNSGTVDLLGIFRQAQHEMLSHLAAGEIFEHPTACGAVTEGHWLDLFNRYLPHRYRAASAFIIDADGRRSRQIDIAIYDNLYSPLLFPDPAGLHLPAESVYAVFEVKQDLNQRLIRDAGAKAASVRRLRCTSVPVFSGGAEREPLPCHPIVAGILALRSGWPNRLASRLPEALCCLADDERLDLGCALRDGAFESVDDTVRLSTPEESLIFLMLRLFDRLRALGTAPAADLMAYGRALSSLVRTPPSPPRPKTPPRSRKPAKRPRKPATRAARNPARKR